MYIYIYIVFNNEGTSLFEKKTANLLTIKSDPWLWQKVTVICYRSVTIDILVHRKWHRSRLLGSNFFIGQTNESELSDLRFVLVSDKYDNVFFLLIDVCYDKIGEGKEREERMERGKLDRICLLKVVARDEINFPVVIQCTRMGIQYA